jgi:hypothetical protein
MPQDLAERMDGEFQKIVFAVHMETKDAATRAAIEFATDEIKVAMLRAFQLGRKDCEIEMEAAGFRQQ